MVEILQANGGYAMNVFVIFSPGLGGNHLANMIATDPRYHSRATVEQYKNTQKYAHHSENKNLNIISTVSNDNNVFCGHFGELYWFDQTPFETKQVVIVEVPKDFDSYACKRWQTFNTYITPYLVEEQRCLYTPGIIERVCGISDFYTIPAEKIITEQPPIELLQNMTYQIDVDKCRLMHSEWIKTNISLDYK